MTENLWSRTRAAQTHVLLVLGVGFSLAYILLDHPLLPEKYSYDEEKIAALARQEPGVPTDSSFQIVADIYQAVGLAEKPMLAGVLGFALFCLIFLVAIRRRTAGKPSLIKSGMIVIVLLLGAVYLGHYSKEFFMLPICGLAILRTKRWMWDAVLLVSIGIYATYFRSYWFIVAALYVMFRILMLRWSPLKSMFLGSVLGLTCLAFAFYFSMGLDLDHYRLIVNDSRTDAVDAQSAIKPLILSGGLVAGLVNASAVLVSFVIPIPLIAKGQIFYLLIVSFLTTLWVLLFRSLKVQDPFSVSTKADSAWLSRVLSLLFAYTVVQSIFEPDYGSYIRHLSPLLPLMLAVVLRGSSVNDVAHNGVKAKINPREGSLLLAE